MTERFTRISAGEILYRYTVDDPATFTQAWTAEMILHVTHARMFEYACHEANYSLEGMLAGGRMKDAGK